MCNCALCSRQSALSPLSSLGISRILWLRNKSNLCGLSTIGLKCPVGTPFQASSASVSFCAYWETGHICVVAFHDVGGEQAPASLHQSQLGISFKSILWLGDKNHIDHILETITNVYLINYLPKQTYIPSIPIIFPKKGTSILSTRLCWRN